VKVAESQAEAQKVRQIKHAEGDAQTRVLMAKAESDSMQYTLPLKQKTDRAVAAGGRSAQGDHDSGCRSSSTGQSD